MKPIVRITLLGLVCFAASCSKRNLSSEDSHPAPESEVVDSIWSQSDFTPWMSRAELQHLQENNPSDQYFAHVEGRYREGHIEYRAVIRPFSSDEYDQWAVFWGINEAELFDWELRLLKAGFTRKDTQVFEDATGRALHQIVWLKAKNPEMASNGEEPEEHPAPAPEPAVLPPVSGNATGIPEEPPLPVKPDPASEADQVAKARPVPEPAADASARDEKKSIYVVQPGDTLGKIAKRKGVSVADLKTTNRLKSDILRIGQKLTIAKAPH